MTFEGKNSRIGRSIPTKGWSTLAVVVVGIVVTGAVASAGNARSLQKAADVMDRRALLVQEAVKRSVQATYADAAGAAGLLIASEGVTEQEFGAFAGTVGRQPGSLGLAYIPVVQETQLPTFLRSVRSSNPGYALFAVGPDGDRLAPVSGTVRYPIRYYVPGLEYDLGLVGFDASTDPVWRSAMDLATKRGGVSVSPLTQLFGTPDLWGFIVVAPIVEVDQVTGFTVSIALVDTLVETELAEILSKVVSWDVRDVTGVSAMLNSPDTLRRVQTIEVVDRLWQVDIIPTGDARADLADGSIWLSVVPGLLATAAAAMAAHFGLGALRSREESRELRRLADEKDEFLAAISHELRTPLTVVVGLAELLDDAVSRSDPDVPEYISTLRQQGAELARLVDDLLLLGRLDAEVLSMRPEVVDLTWEVERIIREVDGPGNIEVSVSGAGVAWADPLRLRHVIRHLHSNALRHADSLVSYRIEEGVHEVRLTVIDDGPGVPDQDLPHLFTAASGKKDSPGSPTSLGLGLRISNRLAKALEGDLSYRRVDGQTTFELRLPSLGDQTSVDVRENNVGSRADATA